TDALLLALRSIGVGPGDEVIVPSYTFFATAEVVMLLGATPRLIDIEPGTYCLDTEQLEREVRPGTKAIIPVHLFGHPANMTEIVRIAEHRGLKVIEDSAQALGASYQGHKVGGLGDFGCISFYPTKNAGAYGDGGMVVTNDDSLAQRVGILRSHGSSRKFIPEMVGYNSRLDELQAAVLRVKLRHLDEWIERRRSLAAAYSELLSELNISLPQEAEYAESVYHLYVVEVENRDRLAKELASVGVSTGVYYPMPLHLVPALQSLGYIEGDFPASEEASKRSLAIPLYPEMTTEQLHYVAGALRQAVGIREQR
ncbi:MAG: DegT/DnrJ/EryC1/StrS family aminotransferase, partial [Dehalococcoidia bacterium]